VRRDEWILPVIDRRITHSYSDPLDLIWLRAASRLDMNVERSAEVYASWDGRGTLSLSASEALDADDSLAQLVFHEICHALVAGPEGRLRPDWGLDNATSRDLVFEHACHRVQAALAMPYGLRDFFAVTTEWRPYWDALPPDPLAPSDDPALPLAHRGVRAAGAAPFAEVLRDALGATAAIADLVRDTAPAQSLWRRTRARHASGFLRHDDTGLTCGTCAWFQGARRGALCRQAAREGRERVPIATDSVACERWETVLSNESCATCGACCREGFDRVELRRGDGARKLHPRLVSTDRFGPFLARPEGRCVALGGDGEAAAYRCTIYTDRPRACAEFEVGGAACLIARRRVGKSA
jgi:hypothetical protein